MHRAKFGLEPPKIYFFPAMQSTMVLSTEILSNLFVPSVRFSLSKKMNRQANMPELYKNALHCNDAFSLIRDAYRIGAICKKFKFLKKTEKNCQKL